MKLFDPFELMLYRVRPESPPESRFILRGDRSVPRFSQAFCPVLMKIPCSPWFLMEFLFNIHVMNHLTFDLDPGRLL